MSMSHLRRVNRIRVVRGGFFSALIVTMISTVGCGRKQQENAAVGTTGKETQKTFASPAEAGQAFLAAARSGDETALLALAARPLIAGSSDSTSCSGASDV